MSHLQAADLFRELVGADVSLKKGEYRTKPTGVFTSGEDVLFGIDAAGHLHLFMPVQGAIAEDTKSAGVQLLENDLVDRERRRGFADLVCTKPHLHATFLVLTDSLLLALTKSDEAPDKIAIREINRWRTLLSRNPSAPLGVNELAGIFAELLLLREFIDRGIDAFPAWTGAKMQRHDFTFSKGAVEVKASLSSQRSVVHIHGFEQLLPPANASLFLLHYRLEFSEGGLSVPQVVAQLLQGGLDSLDVYAALGKTKYFQEHEAQYAEFRFTMIGRAAYAVSATFPTITASSFVDGAIPKAVVGVTYQLDLDQLQQWRVDDSKWLAFLTSPSGAHS